MCTGAGALCGWVLRWEHGGTGLVSLIDTFFVDTAADSGADTE